MLDWKSKKHHSSSADRRLNYGRPAGDDGLALKPPTHEKILRRVAQCRLEPRRALCDVVRRAGREKAGRPCGQTVRERMREVDVEPEN